MKAITKIMLSVSVLLLVLGAAGITAGAFMGSSPSQALRQSIHYGKYFTNEPQALTIGENPEESHTFTDIKSLDLDLSMCELTIYQHDENHVAFTVQNTRSYFNCKQEGDTLELQDDRPTSTTQNSMKDALKLSLYLPRTGIEEISAEVSVGEIWIENIAADSVDISCDIGSFEADILTCRELQFESNIGEVRFGNLQATEHAEIKTGTGDIALALFTGPSLHVDNEIGNTNITASGEETDYNYEINSHLGDSYVSDHHHGHDSDSDQILNNHIKKDHSADQNIEIQCGLGDITLDFTEESL